MEISEGAVVQRQADNTLLDLQNSSDDTKAELSDC